MTLKEELQKRLGGEGVNIETLESAFGEPLVVILASTDQYSTYVQFLDHSLDDLDPGMADTIAEQIRYELVTLQEGGTQDDR